MAGKGAPKGNKYAKKRDTGHSISLYLSSEDMELLRLVLIQHGLDSSDKECNRLARQAAQAGINRLLLPGEYEKIDKLYNLRKASSESD